MTTVKNRPAATTADREIVITRTFEAPRELVWDAMTNPESRRELVGAARFFNDH